jgi:hypothetical protein
MQQLARGATADQLVNHVESCPICGPTMAARRQQREARPHPKVNPDDFPTMMVVGIEGRFVLSQVLSLARQHDKELVVMGNTSPAFKNNDLLLEEAPKFRRDPGLVLTFEKQPNIHDPLCLDPLVIVRRSFFLDAASSLSADTLGELAILLMMEASKRNLRVNYV